MRKKTKGSIYVCHTYYHVYVTFLKELKKPKEEQGKATLVLSKMSTDFEQLKERVEAVGLFEEVVEYDEKRQSAYPELDKYMVQGGNIVANMVRRIIMTKKFGRLCEQDIPVDFTEYEDIYVYCDSDPIGYYLNWKHIPYHAMEDGLNLAKYCDYARYDNRGFFPLKAFMSSKLNLIFIQNGYGKYCIDMEVNDISINNPGPKYVEVKRQELVDRLTEEDKDIILRAFVRDFAAIKRQVQESIGKDKILILTEPLCDLETRERIFRDLIAEYEKEGDIYLKPHPRDVLDYRTLFAEYPQFDPIVPMELLNFFTDFHVKKVVSVFTETEAIKFADESVWLGPDFMDKYEDHSVHNYNEVI
ncbi:MAG: lipooligosaccharide sialyltransferase [Lachnospiraceae bacterium]|nr:lipooligosaccharide sialyltransferase [Lachnospiraceae bacterium]